MRTATTSVLPIASVLICAAPALAQAPVALVEEVRGRTTGIELMDYVSATIASGSTGAIFCYAISGGQSSITLDGIAASSF